MSVSPAPSCSPSSCIHLRLENARPLVSVAMDSTSLRPRPSPCFPSASLPLLLPASEQKAERRKKKLHPPAEGGDRWRSAEKKGEEEARGQNKKSKAKKARQHLVQKAGWESVAMMYQRAVRIPDFRRTTAIAPAAPNRRAIPRATAVAPTTQTVTATPPLPTPTLTPIPVSTPVPIAAAAAGATVSGASGVSAVSAVSAVRAALRSGYAGRSFAPVATPATAAKHQAQPARTQLPLRSQDQLHKQMVQHHQQTRLMRQQRPQPQQQPKQAPPSQESLQNKHSSQQLQQQQHQSILPAGDKVAPTAPTTGTAGAPASSITAATTETAAPDPAQKMALATEVTRIRHELPGTIHGRHKSVIAAAAGSSTVPAGVKRCNCGGAR